MAKLNLLAGASKSSNHHYAPYTLTSMDLGDLIPVRSIECLPSDSWNKIAANGVIRLQPQVFPPYGRLQLRTAAFFVPEHQLIETSEALHSGMKTYKGKNVLCPSFWSTEINKYFANITRSNKVYSVAAADYDLSNMPNENTFDFAYITNEESVLTYNFYKLNYIGMRDYKVLKSLGYDFTFYDLSGTNSDYAAVNASANYKVSALPLLAYIKCYTDMFINGVQYNTSMLVKMLHDVHNGVTHYDTYGTVVYDSSTGMFNSVFFELVFGQIRLPHEQNMYTEAWNSPSSPDGIYSNTAKFLENTATLMSPLTSGNLNVYDDITDTTAGVELHSDNIRSGYLSAFGVKMLLAFDKFVQRFNLSGSRAVQRIYAQFGIKTDDYNSHFVHKLYEGRETINFSPVMSNTDTLNQGGMAVGDYAGFGVSGLNLNFNYKCSDYGYIIILSWLQIIPIQLHGVDPSVLRQNAYDWYTPQFDGQTIRAIPFTEIMSNKFCNHMSSDGNGAKNPFGFTNIYDEYRNMRDVVSGEFVNGLARNFSFNRDYGKIAQAQVLAGPQSNAVQYYDKYLNADLSNPFITGLQSGDRFYLEFEFDIDATRPVMSDTESYGLGVGDTEISKNGVIMN